MELNAPFDPVVLEPVVNREKLRELLALETEYSTLDFKSSSNLSEKRDQVELAKDVGAMSVRGGFLIIGVDGSGKATGGISAAGAELFDEARLRPMMIKWLPDTLRLCSQKHDLDGNVVVLVYIEANPAGCAFFRNDGQYAVPGRTESKVAFRKGEVYFRSGTESTRLDHDGLELVIAQRVHRARDDWQAQNSVAFERLAAELRSGTAGLRVATGPASEFSLSLEPSVLIDAAVELLRADDDIPIRRLLGKVVPDVRALYRAGDQQGIDEVLDRLTCLAAVFLDLERPVWLRRTVDSLVSIYGVAFENEAEIINNPPPAAAQLWLAIVRRVEALGGVAVRRADWPSAAYLAVQRAPGMHRMYTSWLKHATTMGNRAEALVASEADQKDVSIISLARETVRWLECLRSDVDVDDDRLLTSLTQFDFLGCIAAISATGATEASGVFYPHFATFYGSRTQPIAERLLTDSILREQVCAHDDEHLARSLALLDEFAKQVGFRYDGWEGYTPTVYEFINANLPRPQRS